ncbi:Type III effector HopAO1 [Pseudomonas amygdali pv. lachrymans]|nr:Type III effector HopAO1 [Pseudomonas amygdali pv. lachrymans]
MSDLKLAGCERISSVEQVKNIRAALGGGPLTVLGRRCKNSQLSPPLAH